MALVFLMYALFASLFTLGKTALDYASPFFIVGSRMFVAGVLLILFQFFRKKEALKVTWPQVKGFLLLGFFNIYLTNICELWGLQFLSSSKTCFIYSISPFVSAFLSYLILKESMTKQKWLGLAIGFVGLIPMLLVKTGDEESISSFLFLSWAELALIVAAVSSVYGWILIRKQVSQQGVSPITSNGFSMLIGGVMTLVHSSFSEAWDPVPVTNMSGFLLIGVAMLVISNFLGYNLYGFLLKRYSATFMSFAGFSTPLFAALFGWFFLSEQIPWQYWFSLSIIFLGLWLFHREELKTQVPTTSSL